MTDFFPCSVAMASAEFIVQRRKLDIKFDPNSLRNIFLGNEDRRSGKNAGILTVPPQLLDTESCGLLTNGN